MPLQIDPITALRDNYIWAMRLPGKRQTVIVDPGEAQPVLNYLTDKQLSLSAILITHHHWDHTNGIAELLRHYSVPVHASANEDVAGRTVAHDDGSRLELPELELGVEILSVPGHTRGAIAYHIPAGEHCPEGLVFSGDTLFTAGCGRLFEGTAEQMCHSLRRFRNLPPTTLLYCGHEYTEDNLHFAAAVEPDNPAIRARLQTVSDRRARQLPCAPAPLELERETNPFLRCDRETVRESVSSRHGDALPDEVAVFAALRTWKDHW